MKDHFWIKSCMDLCISAHFCEEVLTLLVTDIHFNDAYTENSFGRCSLPPRLKATFFFFFMTRIRKIPPSETKVEQICQQQSYKIVGLLNSGFLTIFYTEDAWQALPQPFWVSPKRPIGKEISVNMIPDYLLCWE